MGLNVTKRVTNHYKKPLACCIPNKVCVENFPGNCASGVIQQPQRKLKIKKGEWGKIENPNLPELETSSNAVERTTSA